MARLVPLVACILALEGVSTQEYARVIAGDGTVRVEVDEVSNALGMAIHEVNRACRCVISYEEPAWQFSGDLAQQPDGRGGSYAVARRSWRYRRP